MNKERLLSAGVTNLTMSGSRMVHQESTLDNIDERIDAQVSAEDQ